MVRFTNRRLSRLLLILLRVITKLDELGFKGMCGRVENLYYIDIIGWDEKFRLLNYIHNNRPPECTVNYFQSGGYWWKYGVKKPRIEWIKKHIKLTRNGIY